MPRKKMNPQEYHLKTESGRTELNILFNQFLKHPGADQFGRLEKAMLSFQDLMLATDPDDMISWTEDEK